MNEFPQSFAGQSSDPNSPSHRRSLDATLITSNSAFMQGERNGALLMPGVTSQRQSQGISADMAGFGQSDMPRSPPKNKNTQLVPCKFYLQGTCQAGRMCPFSHDLEASARPAPCKYFSKGGCKFGRKCALLHITPDGTIVNRMPPPSFQAGQPYGGTQSQPNGFAPAPPGLLSMQAQGLDQRPNGSVGQDFDNYQYGPRIGYDQVDMTFTSASPTYGSPLQNERLAASPPQQGLSVLDAPLPNSFDSNGISMAARNGPFAASVPSRFGIESPPSSLPRKLQIGNTALRDLHSSAFGGRGMDGMLASMGSSPPSGTDEPLTFPKRPLHSERLRAPRPIVSASLGTKLPTQSFEYSDDDDGDTDREEDLLPASLRDLIPEGRTRRESRSRAEEESPAAFLAAQRRTISGHGTPQDSKVGSPHASSPSRYNGLFTRTSAPRSEADGIGRVTSPLRNSGLSFAPAAAAANGELSPSFSSPPKQASMSMLTQGLQRTKLENARSHAQATVGAQAPTSHSGPVRTLSNGSTGRSSLDRGISSTSVTKIDEEQELFDMDEVGGPTKATPRSIPNGTGIGMGNGAWSNKAFGSSPGNSDSRFGAIGGHRSSK